MSGGIAIVVLGESAAALARILREQLPDAELHGLAGRVAVAEVSFPDTGAHLRALFQAGRPIVALCATGLVIRALAPILQDKHREPPVLAIAEDGSAVVPLLGGHHGANDLARRVAGLLGIAPAITTAGDLRFGIALDAPPAGWRLANPGDAKPFAAALLAGASVRLDGAAEWLAASRLPFASAGALTVKITERAETGSPATLVYHPAVLALGVGCERNAAPEELAALVQASLAEAGLAPGAIAGIFSLELKEDEPAIQALADGLGVPARFFPAAALEAETQRLASPSEAVFRAVGSHGVAEAAALAAVGREGRLLLPKRRSARATCAVAIAPHPLEAHQIGHARGRLCVVGLGPGGADWLTPEARALLAEADELVGYSAYLDLAGPLAPGQRRHDFALGQERERAAAALTLAAEGRSVALVSSGDPGIYAMASLVFELVDAATDPAWRRIAIRVAPGISAMQAAAARLGAPLGHDFCAISLSDLLTPWPAIERRIRAAAEADFVIAFYNPVSQRRRHQLGLARDILLRHRAPDTPVALARNLGRAGETIEIVALADLTADAVDMLTLLLVGSSATRRIARGDGRAWLYTPRGYGREDSAAPAAKEAS